MKNKKLVVSVLSTALVSSMAASAFAAPKAGLYIGGDVDKFYSIDAFLSNGQDAIDDVMAVGFENVLYVDEDGQVATLDEMADADDISDVLHDATKDDFEKEPYTEIGEDGSELGTYDAQADKDLPGDVVVPGDVKVESVSAITNTKIAVTLKDAVKAVSKDQFTVEGLTVESATLSADGKVVTLVTSAQTPGKSYTVKSGTTSASWIALVADTVKPAVTSVSSVTSTLVQVNFSEKDATEDSILNKANYVFDNGLTATSVAYVTDANGVVQKDKVYVTTSAQTAGAVYTLTVSNIEDASGNKVDNTLKFQFAGKGADTVAPTLVSATASKGNTVTVTFSDASQLDASTLTNVANYTIAGLTVTKAEVLSNPIAAGNKTVRLTTSAQTAGTVYTLTAKGIKDTFGNTPTTDLTAQFAGTSLDTTPPSISTVTAVSNTKVAVVFNDTLDEATATNVANFSIPGLTVSAASLDKADSTDAVNYKKRVYLTTSAQTAGTVYSLTVSNVKDEAGNVITTSQTYKQDFAGKSADTTAPTVTSAQALAGNKVQIVFADASNLDEASVKTLTNYSFDGGLGYPTSVASWTPSTKTLVLNTATQENGKVYNVTINNVKDEAGNVVAANTKKSFAGIGNALDALAVQSVVALNNRQIQVTFNKDVDDSTVTVSDFTYKKGSGSNVTLETDASALTAKYKKDSKTYIFTLDAGKELTTDVYTFFVDNSHSSVSDLGGVALNTADTTKAQKTFGGITDAAATPTISTVTQVSSTVVEVTFANEVDVTGFTNEATITYDSTTLTSTGATRDAADKKKVRFTFNGPIAANKVANFNVNTLTAIKDVTKNFDMAASAGQTTKYVKTFGTLETPANALKLSSAVGVDEQTIELTFNQEIKFNNGSDLTNPGSGTDGNFLLIKNGDGTAITGADYDLKYVEQTASNKVRVYLAPGTKLSEGNLYKVVISDNAAGDALFTTVDGTALDASVAADATATFGYVAAENPAPYLVSATPLSNNTVQLTFSESISTAPTTDGTTTTDIEFYNASNQIAAGSLSNATAVGSDNKVFTVALSNGVFAAGTTYTIKVPNALTITDKYGVDTIVKASASDANLNSVTFGGSGTFAPSITSAVYDESAGTLVITGSGFTNGTVDISKVTVGGTTLTATGASATVDSDTQITITVAAGDQATLNALWTNGAHADALSVGQGWLKDAAYNNGAAEAATGNTVTSQA